MKRLHVHVGVDDLDQSIGFYSTLFGADPVVVKPDYAKWMLEDPRVNFAISHGQHNIKGIEHLGIQVESPEELNEVYDRLRLQIALCSKKEPRPVVTRNPKRAGSPIHREWCGKPSTRKVIVQTMEIVPYSVQYPTAPPIINVVRLRCRQKRCHAAEQHNDAAYL